MDKEILQPLEDIKQQVNPDKSDLDLINYIVNRQTSMDTQRSLYFEKRTKRDLMFQANIQDSVYNNAGKAIVNLPSEQMLIQAYIGSQSNGIPIKIEADGYCDADRLEIAKLTLAHFQKREHTQREIRKYRARKARYGWACMYSGVRPETIQQNINDSGDYFGKKRTKKKKVIWHIGLKSIDIRHIWFDEKALVIDEAMDCIYQEDMAIEDFQMTYGDMPGFENVDTVGPYEDYSNTTVTHVQSYNEVRNVQVRHYYNKIDGTYAILANKNILIYNGKFTPKHGRLPFVGSQHYEDTENFYGIGIPERYQSIKPYLNSLLKTVLDGAWMNSASAILMGNDMEVDGDLYLESGQLSEWNFTKDIKNNFATYQPNINIGQCIEVLNYMENLGTVMTGVDVKSPYTTQNTTAFEVGVQQEQQNTLTRPVNELDQMCIEDGLTIMLGNIAQFGPTQLADYLVNEDGEEDYQLYKIKVDNKKVDKKKGKNGNPDTYSITDDPGVASFFYLSDDLLLHDMGLKVIITTPYTPISLKSIEKAEMEGLINQIMLLKQIYPTLNIGDGTQIFERLQYLNNIEIDHLMIKNKQDKIREQIASAEENIAAFTDLTNIGAPGNPALPANQTNEANQQTAENNAFETAGASVAPGMQGAATPQ